MKADIYTFVILTIVFMSKVEVSFGICETLNETYTNGFTVKRNKNGDVLECLYVDDKGNTVGVSVNTVFKHSEDCVKCMCKSSGLMLCCSFGYRRASETAYPEGCLLQRLENCHSIIVDSPDGNKSCPLVKRNVAVPTTTSADTRHSRNETVYSYNHRNNTETFNCVEKAQISFILIAILQFVVNV